MALECQKVDASSPLEPFAIAGSLNSGQGEWLRKPRMPEAASDLQALGIGDTVSCKPINQAVSGRRLEQTTWPHRQELSSICFWAPCSQIVLLGGFGINSSLTAPNVLPNIVTYDSVFDRFDATSVPNMPTPVYRFAATAVLRPKPSTAAVTSPASVTTALKGTIVVAGGITSSDPAASSTSAVHILTFAVDPASAAANSVTKALATATWAAGPALPEERSDFALAAVEGGVIAVGGFNANFDSGANTWFLAVDAAAGTVGSAWESRAALPVPRGDLAAVVDSTGKHVMVVGGWGGSDFAFQKAVESYSVETNSWTTLDSLPFARGDKAAALLNDHVVTVGGEITSGLQGPCDYDPSSTCAINQIPVHDTEAMLFSFAGTSDRVHTTTESVWEQRAPHPGSRFRFAAAVANGVLFTFGGQAEGQTPSSEVWAYFTVERPDLWVHGRNRAA
jgi:hypothetical protein